MPEQEVEKDCCEQARDQNGCHATNRGADIVSQVAGNSPHAVEELRPNRIFVERQASGQCVDNPIGSVRDKSRPAAFLKRTPAKRVVSGRQFLGQSEAGKREDDSQ